MAVGGHGQRNSMGRLCEDGPEILRQSFEMHSRPIDSATARFGGPRRSNQPEGVHMHRQSTQAHRDADRLL